MGAFDALGIAGSGLRTHQTWLDALGSNIANSNTMRATTDSAFQAEMVIVSTRTEGGVRVSGTALSDAEGVLVHDPGHPLADEEGYVRAPAMDMASQMSQLIMAQRGFQASSQVVSFAQDTYTTAIGIGR